MALNSQPDMRGVTGRGWILGAEIDFLGVLTPLRESLEVDKWARGRLSVCLITTQSPRSIWDRSRCELLYLTSAHAASDVHIRLQARDLHHGPRAK
jgi:hypothetical protein